MRHGDKVNNLGRTAAHRRALLANLAIALIEHKRITTTLAKAKALRRYVEPLITRAKSNTTHDRRVVFSYLQNKEAIKELFGAVAVEVGDRAGGYVRVIKLGFRRGDGAETAMIELVDFNKDYNPNAGKEKKTKKTRRGSGGGVKKTAENTGVEATGAEAIASEDIVEAVVEETAETVAETQPAEEAAPETAATEETQKKEDA